MAGGQINEGFKDKCWYLSLRQVNVWLYGCECMRGQGKREEKKKDQHHTVDFDISTQLPKSQIGKCVFSNLTTTSLPPPQILQRMYTTKGIHKSNPP